VLASRLLTCRMRLRHNQQRNIAIAAARRSAVALAMRNATRCWLSIALAESRRVARAALMVSGYLLRGHRHEENKPCAARRARQRARALAWSSKKALAHIKDFALAHD